jgi:hypothetical protein
LDKMRLYAFLIMTAIMATTLMTTAVAARSYALTSTTSEGTALPTSSTTTFPPPQTAWNKTYGGNGTEMAFSVQQTYDGGYILAGWTTSFGAGGYDFWVVKTDGSGNQQWNRTYGGTGEEQAYCVRQTFDGAYIIAGYTCAWGTFDFDMWVVKTDGSGNQQWNRTYGGTGSGAAKCVRQTSDGGYIIAGVSLLVKTDSSGNLQWNKTYGGNANSVEQTSDGGYIVAGCIVTGAKPYWAGSDDFWVVKTDSSGNQEWNKTYGGPYTDVANSVQQTSDGGYIIAGYTDLAGFDNYDYWLVKIDPLGNQQWNKTYAEGVRNEAYSVQQTPDGGYVVLGNARSDGWFGVWLVKTNSSGSVQWDKFYGGGEAYSGEETSDGGYIFAGDIISSSATLSDFWLVKVAGPSIAAQIPLTFVLGFALAPVAAVFIAVMLNERKRRSSA